MNLSVVLFILIVVFIKYWLLLFTSPLLMAYCWLHRRKNMANPEGEVSEIRDSGITSSSCSKKLFKRIDKRGLINIVDGYFRWMIKIISDIPSHHIRDFFYKYIFLVKMEKNSVLYYGSEIRAPWMLMIGKGSVVGDNSILDARRGGIYIGENVNIASGEFYQFNLSSCIRQQNSLTAQFVSFSLSNLANIFYPPQFLQ